MPNFDRKYEDETIQLCKLANRPPHVMSRVSFRNCTIMGPAVVFLHGGEMSECHLEGNPDAFIWEISEARDALIGAIGLKDCLITGCTFRSIGFAVKEVAMPDFLKGIGFD